MSNFRNYYSGNYILKICVYVILITLTACSPKLQLSGSDKALYPISSDLSKDQTIIDYYLPYKLRIDSMMNEIVAVSALEISKGRPEGPLNNLMADAMADAGKSGNIPFDIAYTNYGGLRVPLPQGNIALFNIFELMPFENMITTVQFSGSDMKQFFDYMASMGGDPISGATFKISNKKALDIMINGQTLDLGKTYTVLTSDYMANGGDGGTIFLKATGRKEYNIKLRDALLLYMQKKSRAGIILNPKIDGRITVE
ncbi:5'-nucleotidase C-terminal domain-containing protein [Daejeonella sp.]|uniref:5'-nucleotidase C-terminal domain-containing protein n=1 Tax=Daejeonella sp. TaxID=2805397 RepID=UPI003983CE47